jgi:hypothetical protein
MRPLEVVLLAANPAAFVVLVVRLRGSRKHRTGAKRALSRPHIRAAQPIYAAFHLKDFHNHEC